MAIAHPLPTAINGALVAALALVAGAGVGVAAWLALAMLGFQSSIGALNDLVDVERDRLVKPTKPIPSGHVSRPAAMGVAVVGGAVGLAISAAAGPLVLLLGVLGYGCGVVYDLLARRHGLGWLCFAAALPLLLTWTWQAAAGTLPPGWPWLLPLAALAGPTLHLANALVDLEPDATVGSSTLATRLGPRRSPRVLALLMVVILALAWATLAVGATLTAFTAAVGVLGSLAAAAGVALSWRVDPRAREIGWLLQACGLALLAVAWLAAVSSGA
jgi:4-hydroxybenzoate polyprenyltransferase